MRILILGCGNIGLCLVKMLAQQGHQVTAVSRHSKNIAPIQHLSQDIRELKLASNMQFDWVYVILTPEQRSVSTYQAAFIDTARPVFQALETHPIQRLVFISSTRVYGENTGQWIDDTTAVASHDPIGQTLIAAEQLWSAYWQDKLTIIRPSGLYRAYSPYWQRRAHECEKIAFLHWTNRLHRQDLVGFLSYLTTLSNLEPSYIVSDNMPLAESEIINFIREQNGLSIIKNISIQSVTGKRIAARRLAQSGYCLQYPDFFSAHKKA